jgi:hypothetical protein
MHNPMKSKRCFDVSGLARSAGASAKKAGTEQTPLLDELTHAFHRYLSLPEGAAEGMALWIMFAHAFNVADVSPRLALLSPIHECGKTTALTVLHQLVPKPLQVGNTSSAAIFRIIQERQPTLLLDEMDTYLDGNDPLRGILNSGHTPESAVVLRNTVVGDTYKPECFSTWTPIALARIGRLAPTLASRSIIIPMRRKRPDEQKVRLSDSEKAKLNLLRDRISKWAEQNSEELRHLEPAPRMASAIERRTIGGHCFESLTILAVSGHAKRELLLRVFRGKRSGLKEKSYWRRLRWSSRTKVSIDCSQMDFAKS